MSETTKIEWTDTFNPWWGCARVSPACRFCYADGTATRWGHELWRRKGPRRMLSEANWRNPLKWNRAAEAALTPWTEAWPANVWLGTSVEDNQRAAERIPVLLRTKAKTLFLSCEPLLEDVDLSPWFSGEHETAARRPDWVIAGGESGPKARPMHPDWARSLRDQCQAADVAFFFKQWGEWAPVGLGIGLFRPPERLIGPQLDDMGHRQIMRRVGKSRAGRELDGRTWDQFPEEVRA